METIQKALTLECARQFVQRQGAGQILISRYLFEHAEKPLELLRAYRELLADDGFLILEVPDAEGPLQRREYQMIWEEHVSYFTEDSLKTILERNGFSIRSIFKAPSRFEQPLLVLAQKSSAVERMAAVAPAELERFEVFRKGFAERSAAFQSFCRDWKEEGKKIVLFGAGHFAVAFVNFFALEKYIALVIDDDPDKAGLFLAGTSLPIVPSTELDRESFGVVLVCVNPDAESKIAEKLKVFNREGKSCYSIFAGSPTFCLHDE
jgi:hypothetical protein